MSSSDLVRWGGLAAMPAGAVWVVSGILAVVYQGAMRTSENASQATFGEFITFF